MQTLSAATSLLHLFGDSTRVRLLALLERHELSVAELTRVLQVTQSRVSTHLGKLREAGLVCDRRTGTSTRYRLNDAAMPADAHKVWQLLRQELSDAVLETDHQRCESVLRTRRDAWPEAVAGEMEHHYSPGRTWEAAARGFLGIARLGRVLDVGCGDGVIAQLLAPRAKEVRCVDRSRKVLSAAVRRLRNQNNVRLACADMHALPFASASFDQAAVFNVLTYAERPVVVLSEIRRVLRPGGCMSLITLAAHDSMEITARYHHVQPGFSPAWLRQALIDAGLRVEQCEITSRERREPHFQILTAFAHKPDVSEAAHSSRRGTKSTRETSE